MKFSHIVKAVYWEPWLITPQMHASVRKLIESKLAGLDLPFEIEEEEPPMQVYGAVAVIPVEGVILRKASMLEKICGAVGVEDIAQSLATAEAMPEVQGIVLDIDSPGGTVGGVPELGDMIAKMKKKVVAYTGGQMASAAYWLAAGADEIIASLSAEVGSIGVYLPWEDWSKAYESQGVFVEIIRNEGADLKGMGYPGTSLSETQRAELQKGVNQIASMFQNHVRTHRGDVTADTMRGQAFLADEAYDRKLIDDVGGMADAIKAAAS